MELKQIGTIKTNNNQFKAHINEPYRPALKGLEGFSHIIIYWWAHKCDNPKTRSITDCEKPYTKGPDNLGIFSTRSPARPNPLASTVVNILSIDEEGTIQLSYIDADDGTPIIDIKPYHPSTDKVNTLKLPTWCAHWPQSLEESSDFNWEEEFNY